MADGISSATERRRIDQDTTDLTHTDPPPARKAVALRQPDPEQLHEASFGPLPGPAKTSVSGGRQAYVEPTAALAPTAVQTRLDAFRESTVPAFRADGQNVRVPIAFRMTVEVDPKAAPQTRSDADAWVAQETTVRKNEPELTAAARKVGLLAEVPRLHEGRARPEVVRRVTQQLIDDGRLPPSSGHATRTLELRVRELMFDHGIGLDCSCYAQRALLASRGVERAQAGLAARVDDEDLANLDRKGFTRFAVSAARPGDIVSFDSERKEEPGHRAIVYESREATEAEANVLRALPGFATGRIMLLQLDSSWGSHASFARGGVERRTFWHSDSGHCWAERNPDAPDGSPFDVRNEDHLYAGHVARGVFRPRREAP